MTLSNCIFYDFNKLQASLLLLNLQSAYVALNVFVDSLLKLFLSQLLPEGNTLSKSHDKAKGI